MQRIFLESTLRRFENMSEAFDYSLEQQMLIVGFEATPTSNFQGNPESDECQEWEIVAELASIKKLKTKEYTKIEEL